MRKPFFLTVKWLPISILLVCLAGAPPAQQALPRLQEQGNPFIRNFLPREYGAFFQNWCVVQDSTGLVYVGNNSGVLIYDSLHWNLVRTEKETIVKSLAIGPDGTVYVGSYGEFGYLATDPKSRARQFVSLLNKVPPTERAFSDIWSICVLGKRVFFQSLECLFCLEDGKIHSWKSTKAFQMAFTARGKLYVRDAGYGLMVLEGNALKTVPEGERFLNEKLRAVIPWEVPGAEKTGLLIATERQGLFLYDGKTMTPFPTLADEAMKEGRVNHVLRLADGTLGVATQLSGFLQLSREGVLLAKISREEGLPIEAVKSTFQDAQGGVWMALGKGLSRVEVTSPISHFDERRGLPGNVYSIIRYKGTIYAGGALGLFRLDPTGPCSARFTQLPELTRSTLGLMEWDDRLLVANEEGLFEVRGREVSCVRKGLVPVYCTMRSRTNPNRLWIGLQNGLVSCLKVGDRWEDEGRVEGVTEQIRSLYETDDGHLWTGTATKGVLRFTFPQGSRNAPPRIENFGTEQGLPSLNHTYIYKLAGELKVSTHKGIYRYREDTGRFEPDPAFAKLFPEGQRWVYALQEDRDGRIWMNSSNVETGLYEPGSAVRQPDGSWRWEGQFGIRNTGGWVESILAEPDGVVWFCSSEGLIRLDRSIRRSVTLPFRTLISTASPERGKRLFGGAAQGQPAIPDIPYAGNQLRFEYAALDFSQESIILYQTFLEGFDSQWSPWGPDWRTEYSNLPEGSFLFRVRAMNAHGVISSEDSFSFRILPPWYRTWWAYLLWFACGGTTLFGILYFNSRRLVAAKRRLEGIVAERTAELARQRLAAETANEMKSQFLANMSHEIRTPLNAILGFTHFLHADEKDPERREQMSIVCEAGENLLNLINDILDFSKIEAGRIEISRELFSPRKLILHLEKLFEIKAKEKDLYLRIQVGDDIPSSLWGDSFRLNQILVNLVGNALKFTRQGGITVVSTYRDGVLEVAVRDTGIGIAREKQALVFQPFVQADGSTTREFGGTGLGLSICRRVAQLMGGDIELQSQEGVGSLFTVRLPMRIGESPGAGEHVTPSGRAFLAGKVVGILDDNASDIALLTRLLKKHGYSPTILSNTPDIADQVAAQNVDVVLLDLVMDGLCGFGINELLKSDIRTAHIPVIMISGSDEVEASLHYGVFDYIRKPVREDELTKRLFVALKTADQVRNVFVIDDDPGMLSVYSGFLRLHHYNTTVFTHAEDALKRITAGMVPDMIVLDLMMPDLNGFEFLDILRNRHQLDIPALILTAKELSEEERKRLHSTTLAVFSKSIHGKEDFIGFLDKYFQRRRASGQDRMESWRRKLEDPGLEKILQEALDMLPDNVRKLEEAILAGNREEIDNISHNIKGFSGNMGMTEVYAITRDINDESRKPEWSRKKIERLFVELKEIMVELTASEVPREGTAAQEQSGKETPKLLLVEDDIINRKLMQAFLKKLGQESDTAVNGKEALEKLRQHPYDLVFLDIQMPVMGGLETLAAIRADENLRNLRVVALTANAIKGDEEKYLAAGFDSYLAKPVSYDSIARAVREAARLKSAGTEAPPLSRHTERL